MEQMIVKSEDNEEILLYYVEDNGDGEGMTAIGSIDANQLELPEGYVLQDATEADFDQYQQQNKQEWSDSEIRNLLVFYSDNRENFSNMNNHHIWSVACKTMLAGRTPESCIEQLSNLMNKYVQCCLNGVDQYWTVFEICHQAFHNDDAVIQMIQNSQTNEEPEIGESTENSIEIVETEQDQKPNIYPLVEKMLQLYLNHKRSRVLSWQKGLWEKIAREIKCNDAQFWQKKFMNYKQHYIRMLDKRRESGNESVTWPYMKWFDMIYEDDVEFKNKYILGTNQQQISTFTVHSGPHKVNSYTLPTPPAPVVYHEWDSTKITVLVKYYFDCFGEFRDPKIPNKFLWTEVGRLLEKDPTDCMDKYQELKSEHLEKYLGEYDLNTRDPIAIIFDNIISKETELEIMKKDNVYSSAWKISEVDDLVAFISSKTDVFKDPVCYYVCFALLSVKFDRSIPSVKAQWDTLKNLYKSMLASKMDNPDAVVEWRYFEQFERIFDYGTDIVLLHGFENQMEKETTSKVTSNSNSSSQIPQENGVTKDLPYEKVFTKGRAIDQKAIQLLEYYIKNKDKFNSSIYKKTDLWSPLAKKIGMTTTQCSHRFRNLKQVFTSYVQREVSQPEKPITWPYYDLCKKAFGYRATKSKVKLTEDYDKWTAKEIKQLLDYVSVKFLEIVCSPQDLSVWSPLVLDIGRTEKDCADKFAELKRSYHKLKTFKEKDPNFKINWKYYNTIDEIYQSMEGNVFLKSMEVIEEGQEDDYQCIIVLPEGEEMSDLTNVQIVNEELNQNTQQSNITESKTKWNKFSKKKLLSRYLSYIRLHTGSVINAKEMWQEIAVKLNKPVSSCRKMFAKLKQNHIEATKEINENSINRKTPYYALMYKILAIKPKFAKTGQNKLGENKVYSDVPMPIDTVHKALQYYVQHIKDFVSPRFEKKYLWTELANHVSEPVTKVFNKINFLKQCIKKGDISNEVVTFSEILRQIIAKESEFKNNAAVMVEYQDDQWNDDDTEQLLTWYLANLEKFKNPKFVRSYLWMEISNILKKSPLNCSKKMSEVRTQYRNMVKEDSPDLAGWKFYELCQKIYGTGKKGNPVV